MAPFIGNWRSVLMTSDKCLTREHESTEFIDLNKIKLKIVEFIVDKFSVLSNCSGL